MKSKKELLKYYGMCCVSEYLLSGSKDYPSGAEGNILIKKDELELENILGQKKAIEFILGE